jgi:hypothetical protein
MAISTELHFDANEKGGGYGQPIQHQTDDFCAAGAVGGGI